MKGATYRTNFQSNHQSLTTPLKYNRGSPSRLQAFLHLQPSYLMGAHPLPPRTPILCHKLHQCPGYPSYLSSFKTAAKGVIPTPPAIHTLVLYLNTSWLEPPNGPSTKNLMENREHSFTKRTQIIAQHFRVAIVPKKGLHLHCCTVFRLQKKSFQKCCSKGSKPLTYSEILSKVAILWHLLSNGNELEHTCV